MSADLKKGKPFTIKGADGKPIEIEPGEYYFNTKASARRAMKSRCFSPAARIHICLGLHTMGFKQELAVKMEAGKQVPFTPGDLCAETGLPLAHFREHMNCLEVYGLGKCEGSTKGRVLLYGWAIPRDVDVKKIVPRAGTIPGTFNPDIQALLKHYRIRFPRDFVPARGDKEEVIRLARVTKEAESSLRAYVAGLCARPKTAAHKEKEQKEQEKEPPSVGRSVSSAGSAPEKNRPTDRPTPPSIELIPDPRHDPALRAVIEVVESVAVPVLGESPTDAQYIEIYQHLDGARAEHYRERLEAKKAQGKLNSVGVLKHLADDCAKSKDKWKPPVKAMAAGKKSFVESVTEAAAKRLAKWGHL